MANPHPFAILKQKKPDSGIPHVSLAQRDLLLVAQFSRGMSVPDITVQDISHRLADQAEILCRELLPNGRKDGLEWRVGSVKGEAGNSLGVRLSGDKAGIWGDFNGGQDKGDMLDLVQAVLGIDKGEAVQWAKTRLGIDNNPFSLPSAGTVAPSAPPATWTPITPIPSDAGKTPPHPKHGTPDKRWAYRDQNGVSMITARFDKPDGGKDVLPQTYCANPSGRQEWRWQSLPTPRPLYNLDQLAARPDAPVIMVEGEKSATATAKLLPDYVATTWPGGTGQSECFDPAPLTGRSVTCWPDADTDGGGIDAMARVAGRLFEAGVSEVRIIDLPDGLPNKWDLADAMPDGWTIETVVGLIETAPTWTPQEPPLTDANHDANNGSDGDTPEGQAKELEAEAKRLAGLPLSQRAIERKAVATRFGVTVDVLDVLVKGFAPAKDDGSGDEMVFDDIEPWHEVVDAAELLNEIGTRIRSYVVMSGPAVDAVALWCAHAHALEAAYVSPRLQLKSAEKRSGKTTLLHVLRRLVPRPLPVSSISGAGIFRTVHAYQPTLLIDEADRFMRDNEEITGIVNSSHTRGDFAVRMIGQGTDMKAVRFSTWCAMAIAGIGRQADTIEDRSITIPMARKMPSERVKKFRVDRTDEFTPLARKLSRWAADNIRGWPNPTPTFPTNCTIAPPTTGGR